MRAKCQLRRKLSSSAVSLASHEALS